MTNHQPCLRAWLNYFLQRRKNMKHNRKNSTKNFRRVPREGDIYFIRINDNPIGNEEQKDRPCLLINRFEDGDMWEVAPAKLVGPERYLKEGKNWVTIDYLGEKRAILLNQRACVSSKRFRRYFGTFTPMQFKTVCEKLVRFYQIKSDGIGYLSDTDKAA